MAKKDNNALWFILSILFIGLFWYGGQNGWYQGIFSTTLELKDLPITPNYDLNEQYSVEINIEPNTVCTGDNILAEITSNMPGAFCSIYFNTGTGWQLLKNVYLNNIGFYSESGPIYQTGVANFRSICYKDSSYAISNGEVLTVQNCGDTTPPVAYTCGQGSDQGQCLGTCPVGYGCYTITSNFFKWCACATGPQMEGGTGSIHPDWKPDAEYYNPIEVQPTCEEIISPQSQADCDKAYDPAGGQCRYVAGGFGSYCESSTYYY